MQNQNRRSRDGLILLVVLSMLTLFSLLSITYVVFSSQARSASMGMARKDFRGTPPSSLLDGAVRQVLRGTDSRSALWKHSLLEDLYGNGAARVAFIPANAYSTGDFVFESGQFYAATTAIPSNTYTNFAAAFAAGAFLKAQNDTWIELFARSNTRDNPSRTARLSSGQWLMTGALPPPVNTLESVQVIASGLVKIPLQWNAALPEQHDVWNGRVVTFTSGPLSGLSFRVVRYIGEMPTAGPTPPPTLVYDHSLQYSLILDLSDLTNRSLASFLVSSSTAYSLFYNASNVPYRMQMNAGPMNSYGFGVGAGGSVQTALTSENIAFLSKISGKLPVNYRNIVTGVLPNYSYARLSNPSFEPTGDADEPNDVPDFANYALSYVFSGSNGAADVIPSFHRPAVINYLYSQLTTAPPSGKGKPLSDTTYSPMDLFALIEVMQRACARPLAFTVRRLPSPAFDAYFDTAAGMNIVQQNPNFSGSNLGDYGLGQAVTLDVNWAAWGPSEIAKVDAWVRWLQKGPWDVDSDGNGITDSVWTDINLPLMTSPEGKLLKLMAAYYIEDLGGRLDINAAGNREQSLASFGSIAVNNRYSFSSATGSQLPQGLGFGSADISLRHLFSSDADYERFLAERYGAPPGTTPANLGNYGPGAGVSSTPTNDALSTLKERHRHNHNPFTMPGLPMSVFGRSGMGIDLFGNPLIFDDGITNEINDDPYEAHLRTNYRDSFYSLAEWERIYRANDWDRSKLPHRLENKIGIANANAVTPISSSMTVPRFGGTVQHDRIDPTVLPPMPPETERSARRVASYADLYEALVQARVPATPLPPNTPFPPPGPTYEQLPYIRGTVLAQLLPLEFRMNLPLDPNRPLGNGFDDDSDGVTDEPDELRRQSIDDNNNGLIDEPAEIALAGHQRAEYPSGSPTAVTEQYDNFDPLGIEKIQSLVEFDARLETGAAQAVPLWTKAQEKAYFNGNQGRQLLARHLYCLAQLILPTDYVFPNISATDWGSLTAAQKSQFRARTLAQWAVNVVDYRDTDATMTRFPYDENPFEAGSMGWSPTAIVWGQEQPELLLTETLAFHDMRISLKHNPPPNTNRWQQLRMPEGSLFLELLCTRSPAYNRLSSTGDPNQHPGVPGGNLYTSVGGQQALNVAAVTPPDPTGVVFPVWRVLLTDPVEPTSVNASYGSPAIRSRLQYQTATAAGLLWTETIPPIIPPAMAPTAPVINRVVWFAGSLTPTTDNLALPGVPGMVPQKVYRNRVAGTLPVRGGQYLVVGPRDDTYVGQREQAAGGNPPVHAPNPHRIQLQTDWAQMWSEANEPDLWLGPTRPRGLTGADPIPPMANLVRDCVTMVAAADRPVGWNASRTELIGLNISEPTPEAYYPEPPSYLNSGDTGVDALTGAPGFANPTPPGMQPMDRDAYVDKNGNPNANSPAPFDEPLDADATRFLARSGWTIHNAGADDIRPNVASRDNWSTAILQRLANPDLPWNEALNPYITVDWMPIDLTVFNGESVIPPDGAGPFRFGSRQKTGVHVGYTENVTSLPNATLESRAGRTFYSYQTEDSPDAVPVVGSGPGTPFFRYTMPVELRDAPMVPDTPVPRIGPAPLRRHVGDFVTLGYLNSRFGLRGMNGEPTHGDYQGSPVYYAGTTTANTPTAPFFANRDFVNSYELMNVPISSAGQLMQEFTAEAPGSGFAYRHTLDFEMTVGDNATVTPKSAALLFELIAPRSPWVEAEKTINPGDLYVADVSTATPTQLVTRQALSIYRAPFNRIPNFLDFGRVNVNTAANDTVFRGLVWSSMTPASTRNTATLPFQMDFATSRRYPLGPLGGAVTTLTTPNFRFDTTNPNFVDSRIPTEFTGAMKPGFAVDKACLDVLKTDNAVAVSLLRPEAGATARLFATSKLLPGVTLPHNPFVANSAASRLVNLTTDQSHVFAVRVTIGYFEYDPATGLGAEYGIDEGKARRHRAFYVIDRSVPVAFQEGYDMNTDNCILMRRIIE